MNKYWGQHKRLTGHVCKRNNKYDNYYKSRRVQESHPKTYDGTFNKWKQKLRKGARISEEMAKVFVKRRSVKRN